MTDKCCDIFTDPVYNVRKDYGEYKDNLPDEKYIEWIAEVLVECKRVANVLTIYVPKKWNLLYWNILGPEFQEIILPFRPSGAIRNGFSNQFNKLLTNAKPKRIKPVLNVWDNMPQPGMGYFFKEETYDNPGYTSQAITYRAIMELCESEIIYEPFGGTGTTPAMALKANKSFIVSETSKYWCSIIEKRLKPYLQQLQIF